MLFRSKQKTAYEITHSDWSSDVCSSDLHYRASTLSAASSGALLFSCTGRGMGLYGQTDHDSNAFRRLVADVPVGGFFCDGEIGPVHNSTYVHGYTSAFAVFSERK